MYKSNNKSFFEGMVESIKHADMREEDRRKLLTNLMCVKEQKINLMITGATGCGKSSTINALFNEEKAKVGIGVDPETMVIAKYELENLVLWDSPGLGDGKEADNRHAKAIIEKLHERDENGDLLIDLVIVILDGSTRDLGTSYELMNNVIIPNLGDENQHRILVAINQCDVAMKGNYWDNENNKPKVQLVTFLEEKVQSVKNRIKEATGLDVNPIYYKAGGKVEGIEQEPPYNLSKLLYYILEFTPKAKRLAYAENINLNADMWKDNDDLKDYGESIQSSFLETIVEYVGEKAGQIVVKAGEAIGRAVGGALGRVAGFVKSFFSFW